MSLRKPFSEEDAGPLLTLGDRVVWLFEHGPEHGWVRWIGRIPVVSPNWTIGVEFDNPIGAGDGKFGGKRYFYARNDHAYFLPNSSLLRACDYNSSFRKQTIAATCYHRVHCATLSWLPQQHPESTPVDQTGKDYTNVSVDNSDQVERIQTDSLERSIPGIQAKMFTFPHQYSVAKYPFKHQQQTARMLPDELRPRFSELPAVEAKNKTSRGKKEGGGGLVAETVSCANAASTAACSLEVMAGKASPVSLPQISTHANAHTSSGRMRPPVHPNSPTALMQAKLPALFRQLEEAISKGEHDRAAILARELAMYKVSCSLRRVRKVAPDPKQFIVKMYVEDRKSHVGPFSLPVHPEMTVSNLKKKVEAEYNIPARVQRWILGKNLATDDGATLEHFGVSHSACPVFLYLVSPAEELRAEEVIRNRCWKPPDSVVSTEEGEDLANAIARQEPSDASSTLDVLLNDYAAGWTCQLCGINNTEPGTCAMCGVAMVMDASRQSVGADQNVKTTLAYNAEPGEVHDQLEASNSPAQAHLPLNEFCFWLKEDGSPVEEPEQAPSPQTSLPQDYMRLVELDEQDLVPSMEAFECSVCFLGIEPGQGVLLRDCLHMFCRECLSSSVRYAEEAMVKCPFRNNEYSCSSHLQEREIRALVSPEVYEHHLSRSVKTAESQAPNSFHCKTPDCPGWCMLEDNVNTFMCPVCGHQNCLTCRAIHEGKNCLQYQDELDFNAPNGQEAKQTKEYLDKMVQEGQAMHCPQCRVIVMKKWGCDWLKCSVCQTEICWVTKGPRWGPQGKGDTSAGCKCGVNGVKCHPKCNYCH
ncbi:ranBP-type and C3HC4-type zinc finger-containing protein 1 isoform X7 [Rhipicephalus microplus]|uniref:ranBP-type and C3HC4-type zinc finger-containing protein 1 isoform X7 n=1 Tax=Rhipicephalus microplus TaxID=6941 RepID=UPI003F6C7946